MLTAPILLTALAAPTGLTAFASLILLTLLAAPKGLTAHTALTGTNIYASHSVSMFVKSSWHLQHLEHF